MGGVTVCGALKRPGRTVVRSTTNLKKTIVSTKIPDLFEIPGGPPMCGLTQTRVWWDVGVSEGPATNVPGVADLQVLGKNPLS